MKNKKLVTTLLQVYLTIAPINWLPFISPQLVNLAKYIIITILCFKTFITKGINVKPYYFFSINYLLLIILMAIPAIFTSYDNVVLNILDYVFIFALFWIIRSANIERAELFHIFYKVALVISGVGLLSLISAITGITIVSPAPWHDPFSSSAFGGYRTGWSNSLFLFIPFLLFYFMQSDIRKEKVYCIIAITGIIASQILSGGRSGVICSILAILIFSRFNIKGIIFIAFTIIVLYQILSIKMIERFLRASDEQIENKTGSSTIDKISSGRVGGYELGIKYFFDSPLWGNGFGASEYLMEKKGFAGDIHNTWLKRLVDAGLLLVGTLIILFYQLYKSGVRNLKKQKVSPNLLTLFRTMFFLALVISMGEPNYLIGSFQGEAFFWAVMSSCLLNPNYNRRLFVEAVPNFTAVSYE